MTFKTLYAGRKYNIATLTVNEHCFVMEFISGLDKPSKVQITALIKMTGDNGPPNNEEKFKHLGEKIFELKTRTGVRILCFFGDGRSLILTHGFKKLSNKKLQPEISKAVQWEKSYQKQLQTQKKEKRSWIPKNGSTLH